MIGALMRLPRRGLRWAQATLASIRRLPQRARQWVETNVIAPPREWVAANWRSYAIAVCAALCAAAALWAAALAIAAFVIFGGTPTFSVAYPLHFGFWPGVAAPAARVDLLTGFRRTIVDLQSYRAVVELTLPETRRNLQLGSFSLAAAVFGRDSGELLYSSVFSTAMPHRSFFARVTDAWLRIIPQLFGYGIVKHTLFLDLFPSIVEYASDPFGSFEFNISSSAIEVSSARLVITANLSRIVFAVKYHWVLSSVAAILVALAMFMGAFAVFWVGSWLWMIASSIYAHFNHQEPPEERAAVASVPAEIAEPAQEPTPQPSPRPVNESETCGGGRSGSAAVSSDGDDEEDEEVAAAVEEEEEEEDAGTSHSQQRQPSELRKRR